MIHYYYYYYDYCTRVAMSLELVLLPAAGTTRKQSLEHIKGDKPKIRKHLLYTHPDTFA